MVTPSLPDAAEDFILEVVGRCSADALAVPAIDALTARSTARPRVIAGGALRLLRAALR
jgi:hypothetical protein